MDNNERAKRVVMDLTDGECEDVIYFTSPSYYTAIMGISHDNRVVYNYNKMVSYLMWYEGMQEQEAIDWIDYNVLGSLVSEPGMPVVVFSKEEEC